MTGAPQNNKPQNNMFGIGAIAGAVAGVAAGQCMAEQWRKQYNAATPDIQRMMIQARERQEMVDAIRDAGKCRCDHGSGFGAGFMWGTILGR